MVKRVPSREKIQSLVNVGVHLYCCSPIDGLSLRTWVLIMVKLKILSYLHLRIHFKINQKLYITVISLLFVLHSVCIISYKAYPFLSLTMIWICSYINVHMHKHVYITYVSLRIQLHIYVLKIITYMCTNIYGLPCIR